MLEQGFPLEGIAKAAKTSIAEVEEIARRHNVSLPKN
jgi:acyl CoA:acetate/3-ketoacid CoA transferase alpha subunit